MSPWLFLIASLCGAWFSYNVYRPAFAGERRAAISFFAGWLVGELALHVIAAQVLATAVFVWAGALRAWPGWLGLLICVVSWIALGMHYWSAYAAEALVEQALQDGLGADYRRRITSELAARFPSAVDWRPIVRPFPMRHPDVERVRNVPFARAMGIDLKLDLYRHRSRPRDCPTLLQIHGGAWVIGSKDQQAIPLMLHLAARGWVCITANYRLSPHATFPDHLVDVKRALRWIREHGAEHGANPEFVVVTGGSAGGHLAALTALTANELEYQPGFEGVDTRVDACVAFYGVYDFLDRHQLWRHEGLARLLEQQVMKAARHESPEAYAKASPMSRVHAEAPPFLIIHGGRDTLVPVEEARRFAATLRTAASRPVAYAEIPEAQHAFEIFPSLRTTLAIHGVERFLAYVYSDYLGRRQHTMDGLAAEPAAADPGGSEAWAAPFYQARSV
jgi:acetyl esterase/lipase